MAGTGRMLVESRDFISILRSFMLPVADLKGSNYYNLILRRSWEWAVKEMEMWREHIYRCSQMCWHMCVQCTCPYFCASKWKPQIGIPVFSSVILHLWINRGSLISGSSLLRHSLPPPSGLGLGELVQSHTFYMRSGIVSSSPRVCKPNFSSCRPSLQSQRDLYCRWMIILSSCSVLLHLLLHTVSKFSPSEEDM